jgi:hypothetical protein
MHFVKIYRDVVRNVPAILIKISQGVVRHNSIFHYGMGILRTENIFYFLLILFLTVKLLHAHPMKRIILICLILLISKQLFPQEKRPLTFDDIIKWNRITEQAISDDGTLIAFRTEPWTGDPTVTLYDGNALLKASFSCHGINITADSSFDLHDQNAGG